MSIRSTMMSYQHKIVFLLGILLSPRESQGCWPSTPTPTQPECSGQPCGVVCNMTVSGVCDGKGFCVSPIENPCVEHGCGGKQCGEECIQGDIIGTCDSDGECRYDGGKISCPGSGGSVLIVGGWRYDDGLTSTVEVLGQDHCQNISLPGVRWDHVTVTTPDNVHLVCGGSDENYSVLTDCIYLDTLSLTWKHHSTLPHEISKSRAVSIQSGSYILVGSDTNSSLFLPTGQTTWTEGPYIPTPSLYGSCVAKVNSTHVLIVGGVSDDDQLLLGDLTTNTWTQWPKLDTDAFDAACVMTRDGVLIAGGVNLDDLTIAPTLLIDPHTGKKQIVGEMVTGRDNHRLVEVGDRLLAVGGWNRKLKFLTSVEEYLPSNKSWVTSEYSLNPGRVQFSVLSVSMSDICTVL